MRLVRFSAAVLAVLAVACSAPTVTESVLRLTIDVKDPGLRSVCVKLQVREPGTNAVLLTSAGAPLKNRVDIIAGVPKGSLPDTVVVQALGYSGDGCAQPTAPDEVSEALELTFPPGGLLDRRLTLAAPAMSVDADRDGVPFPMDCNDADPDVAPGKSEVCSDQKDNDCNGVSDCAEVRCTGQRCRGPGSVCSAQRCTETVCDDDTDDDADGPRDCADADCDGRPCRNGGTCSAGACMGARSERGLCDDAADNDNDGKENCLDEDCNAELCSDGRGCTTGERCSNFACDGGTPVTCAAGTNVCAASSGVCVEPDGGCVYAPLSADAGCSDGLACTLGDSCDGDGGCRARTFRVCDTPPVGPCFAPTGTCDEATDGGCVYPIVPGLACDDGNACTRDDVCLMDGSCGAGPAVDCSFALPPTECQQPTGGCLPATGCVFSPRTGPCGDGGVCQGTVCVSLDAGLDAGATTDAGLSADGGPVDGGASDAGGPGDGGAAPDAGVDAGAFLEPSNFQLGQLPTQGVPAHYDLNCSGTITLNTAILNAPTFAPDGVCFAPFLPPFARVSQGAGLPELIVFTMNRLTIRPGVTLRFDPGTSGAAERVPVFAVRGDATIDGTISLTALPGPSRAGVFANAVGAGGPSCPTVSAGANLNNRSGGGAGGSFGRVGGAGGRGNAVGGSLGGAGAQPGALGGVPELTPLRGGCRGTAGGDSNAVAGGYAGGAVQLWVQGTLTINGRIVASGGPGRADFNVGGGGGGGGSGGAILIEGTNVVLGATARLTANGGSGAEGNGSSNRGRDGAYGAEDATSVSGGAGGAQCGGNGGRSGSRSADAGVGETAGLDPTCMVDDQGGGGGGGGSVGRVRINALTGCTAAPGAIVSPEPTSNRPSCAF